MEDARHLTAEEEALLCLCVQGKRGDVSPDVARERLFTAFRRLISQLAGRVHKSRLEFEDAYGETCLAFCRAIEKFDPGRGVRLSTYAHRCMETTLFRAMDTQGGTIRIPGYAQWLLRQVAAAGELLEVELRREPAAAELANRLQLTEERVAEALAWPRQRYSLDATPNWFAEDEDGTLMDTLIDERPLLDEQIPEEFERRAIVDEAFAALEQQEAEVLRRRLGFPPHQEQQTLGQIALCLGCSKIGVRNIERRALRKIRHALGIAVVAADPS